MMSNPIWLLKGSRSAPGWHDLEMDFRQETADVLHFDRDRWALMRAEEPPDQYEGLDPVVPPDGLYLDNHGRPCYILGAKEVTSARAVIRGLGDDAQELMDKLGEPDLVLERLGRAF